MGFKSLLVGLGAVVPWVPGTRAGVVVVDSVTAGLVNEAQLEDTCANFSAPVYPVDFTDVEANPSPQTVTIIGAGQCLCDVSQGACDGNCCCDPDCSEEVQNNLFTGCMPESPPAPTLQYRA